MTTPHQTPAGLEAAPAGPAPDKFRALADSWEKTAAEQAVMAGWHLIDGELELAHIAVGRARTLNALAGELRELLDGAS